MSVIIYTTPTCPYCKAAKTLLQNKNAVFEEISLYDLTDADKDALSAKTNGYRTVPQIFINNHFIGGFDKLNQLNEAGQLDALLNAQPNA